MARTLLLTICTILTLASTSLSAQVGIGTSAPKGILDIDSSIYGVVYPSVSLNSTNVALPIVNPQGGALAVGTTVFNTNTTSLGSNDVEPGIYSWDGTKWIIHFFKRQSEIFKQTSVLRARSNVGFANVPGIGTIDGNSLTAKYSGLYKIEVKVNFGGGAMKDNGDVNTAMAEGDFRFAFDGTNYIMNVKSFSTYNDHIGGGTDYVNVWVETYKTIYLNLTAGETYNLSLEFDQYTDVGLIASGNSGAGQGYVGDGIPCFIEITYIDE